MLPPTLAGTLTWMAEAGEYTIEEPIAHLDNGHGTEEVSMLQRWAIRRPRPYRAWRRQTEPLITGQRVLDFFSRWLRAVRPPSRERLGPEKRSLNIVSPSGRMPR